MLTRQLIIEDLQDCVYDRLNNGLILLVGSLIGLVEIYAIKAHSFSEMFNITALSILITFLCWHGNRLINKWHLEYMPWDKNPPLKILHLFFLNGIYTSIVIVLALLAFNQIIQLIPDSALKIAMQWGVGVGMMVGFSLGIAQGEFENDTPDLEVVLGRKTTGLVDFLAKVYG